MITGKLNIDKSLLSLRRVESNFRKNGTNAVLFTARALMERVVERTLAPAPPPPVKYYVRTHRLVSGWGPGANFVGVPVPSVTEDAVASQEGLVSFTDNPLEVAFQAANLVPYAREVEEEGTLAPRGKRRPGYYFLRNAQRDTVDDLQRNVRYAWSIS